MKILMMDGSDYPSSTVYYMNRAFRSLGHEVVYDISHGIPDVVIGIDGIEGPKTVEGVPYIYWDTDSFLHSPKIHGDYLFIGGCPEDLSKYPKGTVFLPHAFDEELHKPIEVEKEFDIVMVGALDDRYSERIRLLKLLTEHGYKILITESAPGIPYSREMSRGKLIFNMSLGKKNIPMRFFEGMAIGCLLTNYNDNLDPLAENGEHYIGYGDDKSLIEIVNRYLDNPKYTEMISKRGREHALKNHTYKHRALTLLSCLN